MEAAQCLLRLQRLCSRAEYCSADVYRKALKDLDGDAEAAARVVDRLREERFVDDARYAAAFAREKASLQGWGPVKIRFRLRGKGLSEEDIAAGLAQVDPGKADARLEKLLRDRQRVLAGDPQARLKLLKYGLCRGYGYDAVEAALAKIGNNS